MMFLDRIGDFFGIVFHIAADPINMAVLFGSVLLGIIFGAMPGLTSTLGVALLTALTYGMDTNLAMVCLLAIFAPSFLLVIGALPFWEDLRRQPLVRRALSGINAAVVGLLLAAIMIGLAWTAWLTRRVDVLAHSVAATGLALLALLPWAPTLASQLGNSPLAAHQVPDAELLGVTLTLSAGGREKTIRLTGQIEDTGSFAQFHFTEDSAAQAVQ